MDRRSRNLGRPLLLFVLTVILAVWVGGSILADAVLIPTAFQSLPRDQAARFGQEVFYRLNYLECILGAGALLLAFAAGRPGWGTWQRHWLAVGLVAGMTGIALVFLLALTPAISNLIDRLFEMGVDWRDPSDLPEERLEMLSIHTVYVLVDGVKIAAGLVVFWLLASRPRR